MNKKIKLAIGALVLIIVLILSLIAFLPKEQNQPIDETYMADKQDEDEEGVEVREIKDIDLLVADSAGKVYGVEVRNGELVNVKEADYDEISTVYIDKVITREEYTDELSEEVLLIKSKLEELGMYDEFMEDKLQYHNGYIVYPYMIKKGDYVFKIQSKLLPSVPASKLLSDLQKVNGRKELSLVYPGEELLFLVHNIVDGYTKDDFVQTKQVFEEIIRVEENLSGDFEFFVDYRGDMVYAYSEDLKSVFAIDPNSLKVEALFDFGALSKVSDFIAQDDFFYFISSEGIDVLDKEGNLVNSVEVKGSSALVTNEDFFVVDGEFLIRYDKGFTKKEMLPLVGGLTNYLVVGDNLFAVTDLGASFGSNTIYKINLNDFTLVNAVSSKGNIADILNTSMGVMVVEQIEKESTRGEKVFMNFMTELNLESLTFGLTRSMNNDFEKLFYIDEEIVVYESKGKYYINNGISDIVFSVGARVNQVRLKK